MQSKISSTSTFVVGLIVVALHGYCIPLAAAATSPSASTAMSLSANALCMSYCSAKYGSMGEANVTQCNEGCALGQSAGTLLLCNCPSDSACYDGCARAILCAPCAGSCVQSTIGPSIFMCTPSVAPSSGESWLSAMCVFI